MARDKLGSDTPISEVVPLGELTDDLHSWIKVPRTTAKKIAEGSERLLKNLKVGQVVILTFDAQGGVSVVDESKASQVKPALKWQKVGNSILMSSTLHEHWRPREFTRIYGRYSSEELPGAPSFRASADTTWSMLVDWGYSDAELFNLVIPKRTLDRRQSKKEPLSIDETDKALRLARIAEFASKVFGDKDKAQRWLRKPKRSLDGDTPVNYLTSEAGARVVEDMLVRIDSGMLA